MIPILKSSRPIFTGTLVRALLRRGLIISAQEARAVLRRSHSSGNSPPLILPSSLSLLFPCHHRRSLSTATTNEQNEPSEQQQSPLGTRNHENSNSDHNRQNSTSTTTATKFEKPFEKPFKRKLIGLSRIEMDLGGGAQLLISVQYSSRGRYIRLEKYTSWDTVRISLPMELARGCAEKLRELIEQTPETVPVWANESGYSARMRSELREVHIELLPMLHSGGGRSAQLCITATNDGVISGTCKVLKMDARYVVKLLQALEAQLRDFAKDDERMTQALNCRRLIIDKNTNLHVEPGEEALKISQASTSNGRDGCVHVPYASLRCFSDILNNYAKTEEGAEQPKDIQLKTPLRSRIQFYLRGDALRIIEIYTSDAGHYREFRSLITVPRQLLGSFAALMEGTLRDYEAVRRSSKEEEEREESLSQITTIESRAVRQKPVASLVLYVVFGHSTSTPPLTPDEIFKLFSPYGRVIRIAKLDRVQSEKGTNGALVQMGDISAATRALKALHEKTITTTPGEDEASPIRLHAIFSDHTSVKSKNSHDFTNKN